MTSTSINTKENYSVIEAAKRLSISTRQLYYIITKGDIPQRKYGGVTRIHKKDLEEYMENNTWLGENNLKSNPHLLKEKTQIQNFGTSGIGEKKKADGDTHQQEPRIIQMPSTS